MAAPLLVLDLDGTLLDTAPDLLGALNTLLGEEGLPAVDRSAVKNNFGQGARALIVEGFRRAGVPLAVDRLEPLVDRFIALYAGRIADETLPFPGALAALDRLGGRGIRFAICTNKRLHLALPLLATLGLKDRFDAVLGGDSLSVRKPHPDHITGTIAAAGGTVETAVMVGDSEADVAAALAAGVPVIGVSFGYTETPVRAYAPDAVIDHFSELEPAIARLLPA